MANLTITNVDIGSALLESDGFTDGLFTFGGADTIVDGTIIARNTSNDKLQFYAKAGVSNGNGFPIGIYTGEDLVATGAGDLPMRLNVGGRYRKERLVIDADGDDANIDGSVIDLLVQATIIPINTEQLAKLDNQ